MIDEEIHDSWIHGGSSDPYKLAALRELLRLKSKWLSEGALTTEDEEYHAFCDSLMMVPEHTWGMDIKRYLAMKLWPSWMHDPTAWWKRLGRNNANAVAVLHPDRKREALNAMKALRPERSSARTGDTELACDQAYKLGRFQMVFAEDGSIIGLQDETGRQWASPSHRIGLYSYEVFSQEDYDRWYCEYCVRWNQAQPWAIGDFGEPGMDLTKQWIRHQTMTPKLTSLSLKQEEGNDIVIARLKMPSEATEQMGAPRELSSNLTFRM